MSYRDTYTGSKTRTFEPGTDAKELKDFVNDVDCELKINANDLPYFATKKRYRITIAEVKKDPKPPAIKRKQI